MRVSSVEGRKHPTLGLRNICARDTCALYGHKKPWSKKFSTEFFVECLCFCYPFPPQKSNLSLVYFLRSLLLAPNLN